MTFTCATCGLHGPAGCYLRFSKCCRPRYVHAKRKVGQGIADWCIGVLPKPRPVKDPERETCDAWRDSCGHSRAEVEKALAEGRYVVA